MILNYEMVLMNKLWGQTQRFEKHNKDLMEENEQLKQHNAELINKIDFLERVIDGDVE